MLEINDAFDEIKETCDTLAEKGKEACKLLSAESKNIEAKKNLIESLATLLVTAHKLKKFETFNTMQKLSLLLDETPVSADKQRTKFACDFNIGTLPDRWCTDHVLQSALDGLDHGKLVLEMYKVRFSKETVIFTKVASATLLLDVLRLKLHHGEHDGSAEILDYLWTLSCDSEACCQRLTFLGVVNLLLSCFETFKSDHEICCKILGTFENLADYHSLHENLISPRVVDMLVHCMQTFTMSQRQVSSISCAVLSSFVSIGTLKWPENCRSRENVSSILIETCKQLSLTDPLSVTYISLQPSISHLSQEVSEAAKYYAVWILYMCIYNDPDRYCPMLISEGGVSVLKQQSRSHEYVQRLSKMILAKLRQQGYEC